MKKSGANTVLILALIFFATRSLAQEKLFRSYSVKDGLASNTVYDILLDKKGFLWFATDAGVSLFDGTGFTNFTAKDGLADNDVFSMFQDNEGRIWFFCFNQQPCFYYNGRFFNANNFNELKKIKKYNWHTLFISGNDVWFSGFDKNYRFRDNKISEFSIHVARELDLTTKIGSQIYTIKDRDLYVFNEKKEHFEFFSGIKFFFDDNTRVMDLGDGNFILVEHKDINNTLLYRSKISPEKHTVETRLCGVYNKEVLNNILDKKNNLVVLTFTDNTVIEKDLLSDSLNTIAEYKLNSIASDQVIDPQGNKWISLLNDGVEMFPKTKSEFVAIPQKGKSPNAFYSIVKMNDKIILGDNTNTLFFIQNGKLTGVEREKFQSANNRLVDLKTDKHRMLWMGTDNGLCIYDPKEKQFFFKHTFLNVKNLKYDDRNDVIIGASSRGAFTISCRDTSNVRFIHNDRTICIAGSLSDTVWYETLGGLYIYHNGVSFLDTALSYQFESRITCLETDKKGRLWVGTSSNGVFVVVHDKIRFHFTTDDGLTSNICKNIFIDEHDNAWLSTNLGVSNIYADGDHFGIAIYNDKNCLIDNNVNGVLEFNDTVYVVSSTGATFFNKNNISNKYLFPVYITKVKIPGGDMVAEDSMFKISSKRNTISISFSGLSYLSNGDIKYEYYINELNTKPQVTKNNSVTYSGLAPGTYNFYVSATDVFGNKSIRPAHIKFKIVPEWYQLIWLRWVVALSLIAIAIFLTFKYSIGNEKRKRLQSELNQTISRLELEAIRLQINPHFIFNCLNAIQNAIYSNDNETASYFINRFAKLMRKALMLSKESFISIDEEYNFINNYLEVEQLRHNNSFDYIIEIDNSLNKSTPFIPAFVLQPFIENSVNHGIKYLKNERGLFRLKFIKNGKLEIHLIDNGIGIEASKKINEKSSSQHSSRGIDLIMSRVDSLNKIYSRNIQIKIMDNAALNKNEHGTTVIISFDLL